MNWDNRIKESDRKHFEREHVITLPDSFPVTVVPHWKRTWAWIDYSNPLCTKKKVEGYTQWQQWELEDSYVL